MGELIVVGTLLIIGYVWGSSNETKHYASIKKRERKYFKLPATNFEMAPYPKESILGEALVMGSTVVSIDYFKRFLAGFKMLVGGRLTSYESLIDRARREAILRMKDEARGYDMIINVRVETSTISAGANKAVGSIEVLAYGTAIKVDEARS